MLKGIKSFFCKVAKLFTTPEGQAKVNAALSATFDVIQEALPVCELIASLTPTRADDEIIALIKRYAVPLAIPAKPMTDLEKSMYLKTSAVTVLKSNLNYAGVSDKVLNAAVEVAYLAYSAAKTDKAV